MALKNKHGNPPRKPKKTIQEDVANLVRATRGAVKSYVGSQEAPASKVQDHHRRTSSEIDKYLKK